MLKRGEKPFLCSCYKTKPDVRPVLLSRYFLAYTAEQVCCSADVGQSLSIGFISAPCGMIWVMWGDFTTWWKSGKHFSLVWCCQTVRRVFVFNLVSFSVLWFAPCDSAVTVPNDDGYLQQQMMKLYNRFMCIQVKRSQRWSLLRNWKCRVELHWLAWSLASFSQYIWSSDTKD